MNPLPVYLDYNGTTPLDPKVIAAMKRYLEKDFGNPSSNHWYGIEPKKALERSRRQVASLINCSAGEIIFTSGGTEANNFAIKGVAEALTEKGDHIITSQIEHPSVLEVCSALEEKGYKITRVPVDQKGIIDPDEIKKSIGKQTILITIMHSNNETGSIQQVKDIAYIARRNNIIFHTDASQSIGKIIVDVEELGVDLLTIAGHKLYAPKGTGALYIRKGTPFEKFMHGAGQEKGQRAGTENIAGIAGLGMACETAEKNFEPDTAHIRYMRDLLYEKISGSLSGIRLNGNLERCLPNTLSISFRNIEAVTLIEELGLSVAASAGAACHSGSAEISHVLKAMGVPEMWARGTLRFSTGRMTTEDEIIKASEAVIRSVESLASN